MIARVVAGAALVAARLVIYAVALAVIGVDLDADVVKVGGLIVALLTEPPG